MNKDKIAYNVKRGRPRKNDPRYKKPPKRINTEESVIINLFMKKHNEFKDRRSVKKLVKSLSSETTPNNFYSTIREISNKYTASYDLNKEHPNFFNVIVEVHRLFKKYSNLDDDLRSKYADKVLGIYSEYALPEDELEENL